MPKLAMVASNFAEPSLIIGTLLCFFGGPRFRVFWMAVDTLSVLLVTVSILLVKLADWNLFFDVHVKVLAIVFLSAGFLQPVHTYFLFQLCHVGLRCK